MKRSAKQVIHQMADDLMCRQNDPDKMTKLIVLESIASKMSWMFLFSKIKNYRNAPPVSYSPANGITENVSQDERRIPWWQK